MLRVLIVALSLVGVMLGGCHDAHHEAMPSSESVLAVPVRQVDPPTAVGRPGAEAVGPPSTRWWMNALMALWREQKTDPL